MNYASTSNIVIRCYVSRRCLSASDGGRRPGPEPDVGRGGRGGGRGGGGPAGPAVLQVGQSGRRQPDEQSGHGPLRQSGGDEHVGENALRSGALHVSERRPTRE